MRFSFLSCLLSRTKSAYLCSRNFYNGVSAAFFLDVSQQSKTEHGSGHEMKFAFLCHRVVREGILIPIKKMKKKVLDPNIEAGSKESKEPRLLGSIVSEMLHGNSPLAIGYRQYIASQENTDEAEGKTDLLFRDIHPNTELAVDLKLLTRKRGRMRVGEYLDGALARDSEAHFWFIQNAPMKKKVAVARRYPHIYEGMYINVSKKDDGTLHPSFNRPPYTEDFTFKHFCLAAAEELLMVAGLIGENTKVK